MKDGGPAFPSHGSMGEVVEQGMSLRDYFAAAALPEALIQASSLTRLAIPPPDPRGNAARIAYEIADAMLIEREKK